MSFRGLAATCRFLGGGSPTCAAAFVPASPALFHLRKPERSVSPGVETGSPASEPSSSVARRAIRVATLILAALFLVSSAMNLGAKVPLGFAELSFSSPSTSTAEFEVAIALALVASAWFSLSYGYAGAYLFSSVGLTEGLLSPDVQGAARGIHEAMVPFALTGWLLLAFEAQRSYSSARPRPGGESSLELVIALQFFVGGLVTLGGAGFARGAVFPVGTALGLVHLGLGLTGLFGGYAVLRKKPWSRSFLLAVNGLTIAYSGLSEGVAQVYALLPPGVTDALVGTVVAIVASSLTVWLLLARVPRSLIGGYR